MRIWRVLVGLSAPPDFGEIEALDATGFRRHHASRHHLTRVGYNFDDIKTTALVGCETIGILDIHFPMQQPHDTRTDRQVLTEISPGRTRSLLTESTTGTRLDRATRQPR